MAAETGDVIYIYIYIYSGPVQSADSMTTNRTTTQTLMTTTVPLQRGKRSTQNILTIPQTKGFHALPGRASGRWCSHRGGGRQCARRESGGWGWGCGRLIRVQWGVKLTGQLTGLLWGV